MLRKLALATTAVALAAAPVAAQADLSRSTAPVNSESELEGQSTLFFILGIAAVAAAIVLLSEDDDPASP